MEPGLKTKIFNTGAGLYDLFTSQATWRRQCRKLNPGSDPLDQILDVGCGPGVSTFELETLHPEARVIGLDIAENMIRRARDHKRERESSVEFLRSNAEALPFGDGRFDLVTGHSFLYLLNPPGIVLREIYRTLREGGEVAFLEPRQNPGLGWFFPCLSKGPRFFSTMVGWQISSGLSGRFSRSNLEDLLEDCGFQPVSIEVTLDGLGWIVRARKT